MALAESFLFPKYRSLNPCRRYRNIGRNVTVCATAAAWTRQRRPQNVEGEFFVDHRCIDCDTCRWMAPETFKRVDEKAAVTKQPSSPDERIKALQALLSCPTSSIHTENPPKEIKEVHETFPLPIDEQNLPGIYHCGYHSERSYGAAAYVIVHPNGNILVDSPRYTEKLVNKIEMLGGVRYMFLTHKDDIADHEKWSKRFGCERILHSADGSVSLLYKPLKVLFTGDHFAISHSSELTIFEQYNRQSVRMQLNSVRKFLDLDFEWILPSHGRRVQFRDNQEKNSALESFLANKAVCA